MSEFTSTTRGSSGFLRLNAMSWLGEGGGAAGGFADFDDVPGGFGFCAKRVKSEIAVSENGGEEIIEIVRDSTGELAERFHFLRAQNLILQIVCAR